MTWHSFLYNCLLLATALYAAGWGGWPERSAILVWAINNALSAWALAASAAMFERTEMEVFAVDLAAFGGFLAIALSANRRWPMFSTAMIACELLVHLCKVANPSMLPFGYGLGLMVWGYAVVLSILLGTWRQRLRLPIRRPSQR
jgi:hypothetical protein